MKYGIDLVTEACDLYRSGLSIREASEKTGIPYRTVHMFLVNLGVERRKVTMNGKHWSEKQRVLFHEKMSGRKWSQEQRHNLSEAKNRHYNGLNGYGHTKPHNSGYVQAYCPDHPNARNDGYVMLHVVTVERSIGRYLLPDETVHHINHDKKDNRLCNLQLMKKHEHLSMHMKERRKKGLENAENHSYR